MSRKLRQGLAAIVLAALAGSALGQESPRDPMSKLIWNMFKAHEGKTLCLVEPITFERIRAGVVEQLKSDGAMETVTAQAVAVALWTRHPCPFSPFRSELRPASAQEIEGVWLFPESSQKYRSGPRSNKQLPTGPLPVKCDAVAYYPNGELRHAVIAGQLACPFRKASDMDAARANPRVSNWAMLRDSRLSVTRTDVQHHIEEWDVYVVSAPFKAYTMQFEPGDLVSYVRRENGNEVNAATQFRHLKRL